MRSLHFAGGVLRQLLHELDDLGNLEVRQSAPAVGLQFRSCDIGSGHDGGFDLLAVDAIRDSKGRRLRDGGVAEQDGVDLCGRYFLTTTIDQFLDPTGEPQVSVAIKNSQVTRSKPSVGKGRFV